MRELEVESGGPVWDLVAEFLERREHGDTVDPDEFIRAHPDVAERLRECLAGFQWMDATVRPDRTTETELLPRTFGNYELERVIGRGGMGCVYEAVHRPLGRQVAVKVLPPHLTHLREFRLRFLREARVVASLHHTNIAPVFEVGQIANTLYLAMPFLDGPNLRELTLPPADDERTACKSIRARMPLPFTRSYFRWVADIGVQAADALAHAHSRGVIHRDMKPSNLLVDEHGAVWVVDFGLAKADQHPTVSVPGELIGTLRYASPEQIRGEPPDERTDVYGLGVTLYELLTRRPAFLPGPSTQMLTSEPMRPRQVSSRIPRDLETIILRALAKRPQDRYPSSSALADDLRRFLRDEPIRARPIGPLGRSVRWCRRNPAMSTVITVSVVLLAVLAIFDHVRLAAQRNAAIHAVQLAADRLLDHLTLTAERLIESDEPGRTQRALELIRDVARQRFRPELWELAIRALDQVDVTPGPELVEPNGSIQFVALAPDASDLIGATADGRLEIWNSSTGGRRVLAGIGEPITAAVWSPDKSALVAVSPTRVWIGRMNRSAGTLNDAQVIGDEPAAVAFSPDARYVALCGTTTRLWDRKSNQLVPREPASPAVEDDLRGGPYHAASWSPNPDGRLLAAVRRDEPVIDLWSMPQGMTLPEIRASGLESVNVLAGPPIAAVAFSPDGRQLACGCVDGTIRLFDPTSPVIEHTLRGHDGPVRWLAYGAGSGWLVSADERDVRLWDAVDPAHARQLALLVRNADGLRSCSLDRDGRTLATVDSSAAPRLWRLPDPDRHRVIGPEPGRITAMVASPDGRWLAWSAEEWGVSLMDAQQRTRVAEFDSRLRDVRLAFSPDPGAPGLALAGRGDPPIRLRAVPGGEMSSIAEGRPPVTAAAFIGSEQLAAAHADGKLIVWNLQSGKPFATVDAGPMTSLAASSDGKWLAGGGRGGELHLWSASSMSHKRVPAAHTGPIWRVTFDPENNTIASTGEDGRICRWRVPDLTREFAVEGPGSPISDVAFCLGGSTLASTSGDSRIILWSASRPDRVGVLTARSTGRLDVLAVTPDGRRLIAAGGPRQPTVSTRGVLEIWDLAAIRRAVLDAGLPDWSATE